MVYIYMPFPWLRLAIPFICILDCVEMRYKVVYGEFYVFYLFIFLIRIAKYGQIIWIFSTIELTKAKSNINLTTRYISSMKKSCVCNFKFCFVFFVSKITLGFLEISALFDPDLIHRLKRLISNLYSIIFGRKETFRFKIFHPVCFVLKCECFVRIVVLIWLILCTIFVDKIIVLFAVLLFSFENSVLYLMAKKKSKTFF